MENVTSATRVAGDISDCCHWFAGIVCEAQLSIAASSRSTEGLHAKVQWKTFNRHKHKQYSTAYKRLQSFSFSVLTAIFQVDLVSRYQSVSILDFIGTKGNGGGGDNWSYKTCTAPVKTNTTTPSHFNRPDALPVIQPTVSKHWRKNVCSH